MSVYKAMYYRLFNRVTDALTALQEGQSAKAEALLKAAQQETEEMYLSSEEQDS